MSTIPLRWLLHQSALKLRAVHILDSAFTVVHATELTDPTEFTTPGSLILTVGLAFEHSPEEFTGYVQRLVEADVQVIGFGTGVIFPEVPEELIDAARTHHVSLFEVPRATAFISITNAVMKELSRRTLAEQTALLEQQEKLNQQARHGLEALLQYSSEQLGAKVEVTRGTVDSGATDSSDPDGFGRHSAGPTQRGSARTSTGPDGSSITTLSIPIVGTKTAGGAAGAYVVASSTGRFSASARSLLRHLAGLIGLMIDSGADDSSSARSSDGTTDVKQKSARLALGMLLNESQGRELAREWLAERIDSGSGERSNFSTAHLWAINAPDAKTLTRLTPLLPPTHFLLDETNAIALTTNDGTELEEQISDSCRVISRPNTRLSEIDRTLVRHVIYHAQALSNFGVKPAPDTPPWLSDPAVIKALEARREILLGPLYKMGEQGEILLNTLQTYLLCGAQVSAAAERLGVHRHTVRGHLDKIEQLCPTELRNPLTLAELSIIITIPN